MNAVSERSDRGSARRWPTGVLHAADDAELAVAVGCSGSPNAELKRANQPRSRTAKLIINTHPMASATGNEMADEGRDGLAMFITRETKTIRWFPVALAIGGV